MKRGYLFFIFFIFVGFLYGGVLSAVKGEIANKKNGEKIDEVRITIESLKVKNIKYTVFTDKKGSFYKSGLQPGVYSITYEKKGFLPKRRVVRVGISETVNVSTELEPLEKATLPENEVKKALDTFESGKYEKAIAKFVKLKEKEPKNPVYYFYIALSYERLKNIGKAIEYYQKSLEVKPDFTFSLQKLGTLYAKKGNFTKAIEYYKKAVEKGDSDADTYYNFGVCYINLGDNKNAKKIMEKVIELDPNYSDAYYQLGIIYLGLGDMKKAKEYLTKFIKMDPENKNTQIAKSVLKSIK